MKEYKLKIKETSKSDLDNIEGLWNNGQVMKYVGFPGGLGITRDKLDQWLEHINDKPSRCHYSIYEDNLGYCGESFYYVDENGLGTLDIKLLAESQGRGIAKIALKYVIDQAFNEGRAKSVYVEPDLENKSAWNLYEKLGFIPANRPDYLEPNEVFLQLTREDWMVKYIKIEDPIEKSELVKEILSDLPEWFGLPESTKSYIKEASSLDLWLAKDHSGNMAFITLKETSNDTGEIHSMAVKKAYHRRGLGRKLYEQLEAHAKSKYKYLQVKTVDEGNYAEYDQTVAFYKSLGFSKLEVFPSLWDEWNPCLLMIKYIK